MKRLLVGVLTHIVGGQGCDALDDLRHALQRHEEEADGQDELDRPAHETARIRRHLAAVPGVDEPGPRDVGHHQAEGHQAENAADEIDPGARALAHPAVDEIDAHVFVDFEGVGGAEHRHYGEHVPLRLEKGVRVRAVKFEHPVKEVEAFVVARELRHFVDRVAKERVERAQERREQDEPDRDEAEPSIETIDGTSERQQAVHNPPFEPRPFRPSALFQLSIIPPLGHPAASRQRF